VELLMRQLMLLLFFCVEVLPSSLSTQLLVPWCSSIFWQQRWGQR
jgi:hypothetical protein